ncbi:unnamed protein product, partial [Staurois parvus]
SQTAPAFSSCAHFLGVRGTAVRDLCSPGSCSNDQDLGLPIPGHMIADWLTSVIACRVVGKMSLPDTAYYV